VSDRTVHASGLGIEVARYDRSGKWWVETTDGKRRPITVSEAVDIAEDLWRKGGTPHMDRPGGARFNSLLRKRFTT